jgi:hypothetical protein
VNVTADNFTLLRRGNYFVTPRAISARCASLSLYCITRHFPRPYCWYHSTVHTFTSIRLIRVFDTFFTWNTRHKTTTRVWWIRILLHYKTKHIITISIYTEWTTRSSYSFFIILLRVSVCRDSVVGIATRYELGGPGIESQWGARFSAPAQTGPGAYPAFCTMGTGSFPGVKRPERGVDHPPHPAPRLKKE